MTLTTAPSNDGSSMPEAQAPSTQEEGEATSSASPTNPASAPVRPTTTNPFSGKSSTHTQAPRDLDEGSDDLNDPDDSSSESSSSEELEGHQQPKQKKQKKNMRRRRRSSAEPRAEESSGEDDGGRRGSQAKQKGKGKAAARRDSPTHPPFSIDSLGPDLRAEILAMKNVQEREQRIRLLSLSCEFDLEREENRARNLAEWHRMNKAGNPTTYIPRSPEPEPGPVPAPRSSPPPSSPPPRIPIPPPASSPPRASSIPRPSSPPRTLKSPCAHVSSSTLPSPRASTSSISLRRPLNARIACSPFNARGSQASRDASLRCRYDQQAPSFAA